VSRQQVRQQEDRVHHRSHKQVGCFTAVLSSVLEMCSGLREQEMCSGLREQEMCSGLREQETGCACLEVEPALLRPIPSDQRT
jgi:hypothetical protein